MTVRILAISGSLRRESLNTHLLHYAEEIASAAAKFDHFDRLADIPLFNADNEYPAPEAVTNLRARIRDADAVLVATPEYNGSVPGGLKNALDWVSRPDSAGSLALDGRPVAIVGATGGALGTVRAQLALRQVLHTMKATVLGQPEVLLFHAHQQFDENGALAEGSRALLSLRGLLDGLLDLVARQGFSPREST
jgi:chromate reductase